ncbi:sugar-binding transcriptional regulator [Paenibacillus alkalitolerans]|uniref:sugar-binding transcriptional regulator n=1 Tax=Paenibacillus alkalitolerans TaxID=2799335 RepID=UPI0018F46770|nr:sugar-binding transcriptional regulator [Paenibacillus alkalitolerans]
MINREEKKVLIKIAKLYYFEELTQAEIAKKIGVSRPIISKMLQKAKQSGIVEIIIHDDTFETVDLEQRIESAFGLDEVLVFPSRGLTKDMLLPAFGKFFAPHLSKAIRDAKKIGVGWGSTLYHLVSEFPYENREGITVVPLVGGVGTKLVEYHSNQIAYELAKKLNGRSESLYAPAVVGTVELKNQLTDFPNIASVLQEAVEVDVALIGIGTPYYHSTMKEIGYLNDNDIEELRANGVIGDLNSRFIMENGTVSDHPINDKVIGIDLEQLKNINKVIGVAIGAHKAQSIIAALRGGYLDVLAIDDQTAETIDGLIGGSE